MFEVVEYASVPRSGSEDLNEDAIVVTDVLVAVIDGETNKGEHQIPSPGRLATGAIVEALHSIDGATSPQRIVERMHEAVRSISDAERRTAAAVAILHVPTRRVIRIGDLWVSIDGDVRHPAKHTDVCAAEARARCCHILLDHGVTEDELRATDPCRELVVPMLRAAARFRNDPSSPFGFASIDGTSTPASLIDVFELDGARHEVVLASDGFAALGTTLSEAEMLHRDLVLMDPLRIGPPPGLKAVPPGASGYDDRSYVRVLLS